MQHARLDIEISSEKSLEVVARWQRTATGPHAPFELLGRAFELAIRESDATVAESFHAFCRGAMLRQADVTEALQGLE